MILVTASRTACSGAPRGSRRPSSRARLHPCSCRISSSCASSCATWLAGRAATWCYPAVTKAARSITLDDGSSIVIRPIQAGDRDLLARMFERLGHEARRARFRGRVESLSEEDLDYLTDVDQYRHDALVAVDASTHEGVGVARYVRLPGRRELAEVAVEVADDWRRRGLATTLLIELTERARSAGVERYSAI